MHGPHRELISQLGCRFRIQLGVIGWPFFVRTMGRSGFTCLWGCVYFFGCGARCSSIINVRHSIAFEYNLCSRRLNLPSSGLVGC